MNEAPKLSSCDGNATVFKTLPSNHQATRADFFFRGVTEGKHHITSAQDNSHQNDDVSLTQELNELIDSISVSSDDVLQPQANDQNIQVYFT